MLLSRTARALGLVVAAAVGFAASEVAVARGTDDVVGPVLELAQAGEPELVARAGGLSVSLPVRLRNAGTSGVVVSQPAAAQPGLRLGADVELAAGERSDLRLERVVECDALTDRPLAAPQPVTVTGRSGGQERALPLRLDAGLRAADTAARTACGRLAPAEALQLQLTRARVVDGIGRLSFDVRNASTRSLQVRDLLPADGVQVQLLDGNGRPIPLPVDLPPGRSASAGPSGEPAGRVLRWTAVFFLDDCGSPLPGSVFAGGSVFSLVVAGGSRVETASFGNARGILDEMDAETCA